MVKITFDKIVPFYRCTVLDSGTDNSVTWSDLQEQHIQVVSFSDSFCGDVVVIWTTNYSTNGDLMDIVQSPLKMIRRITE